MPKGFTDNEKKLIGEKLLEAGHKLFAVYGLKKTNVEELAKAAGISKGAFYIFHESKEALFMDVVEQAEKRVRKEVLAAIDLPGPSPRARLAAVLKKAFSLFETMPILKYLTGGDYDLLFRRLTEERLQEHLVNDQAFFEELLARCRNAGIPIQAQPEQIVGLLYPLVLALLHENDLGRNEFSGSIDMLLDLVAAFSLGEVEIQVQNPANPGSSHEERKL
jgi:AcrR family transcriptional regulator